jgi:uncharacterized protein
MPLEAGSPASRRRIGAEIAIVLLLSLGASAVYAVVAIIYRSLQETALSEQSAVINRPLSDLEVFDLVYRLLSVFFDLVPVALVCYLLWSTARPHLGRLGLTFDRPVRDVGAGLALALAVGIPGLAAYIGFLALGINAAVVPTAGDSHWWTVPVLLLVAVRAALTEEVIAIGYLYARLGELGWGRWRIILFSAVLRGSYHLYQGYGAFIANLVMGIAFGWLYTRFGRLLPLIVTHFAIDAAVFIGYPWAASTFPALFGL